MNSQSNSTKDTRAILQGKTDDFAKADVANEKKVKEKMIKLKTSYKKRLNSQTTQTLSQGNEEYMKKLSESLNERKTFRYG